MLIVFFTLFVGSALAQEWTEIYTRDAVTVSKQSLPDSRLVAFKGDTLYSEPLDKVLYVLLDHDHRVEWVDRLYINTMLEEVSPHEYVLYQGYELPFIFSNRDYVYRGVVTQDASTGVVTLDLDSIEHPDAPETIGVRAELLRSRYVLTPLGPNDTQLEVEIVTDPKGAMPIWLVNLIQRSWPLNTLNGVRNQLAKPYTGHYPLPAAAPPEPVAAK